MLRFNRLWTYSLLGRCTETFLPDNLHPYLILLIIFSLIYRCVLLELFTDGTVPFKLSDMLNYRRDQNEEISKLLDSVSDSAARVRLAFVIVDFYNLCSSNGIPNLVSS